MYHEHAARGLRPLGEGRRLFHSGDGLGDPVFNEQGRILCRGVAQDQDRRPHARRAQLQRLVQAGHRQVIRSY